MYKRRTIAAEKSNHLPSSATATATEFLWC